MRALGFDQSAGGARSVWRGGPLRRPIPCWRAELSPNVGNRTLVALLALIIVRPSAPTDDRE